jgi:hypothetical protein
MAGSEKVDPAVAFLLPAWPHADRSRASLRRDDGFPGFQSIQKMLARELHMNVPAAMCLQPELPSDS